MNHHTIVVIAAYLLVPLTALRADHPPQAAMMEMGKTSLTVVCPSKPEAVHALILSGKATPTPGS
jgi:hypothetical protein